MDKEKWNELEVGDIVWVRTSRTTIGYAAEVISVIPDQYTSRKTITVWSEYRGYEDLGRLCGIAFIAVASLKGVECVKSPKELKPPCYVVIEYVSRNKITADAFYGLQEGGKYGDILSLNGGYKEFYDPDKHRLYPVPYPYCG